VIAALDLIPDNWQSGVLNEIIMVGAVVAAFGAIVKMAILPVWRSGASVVSSINDAAVRLQEVPDHSERLDMMESQIKDIHEALRPTNGDRRSISDRLDTVKYQTGENSTKILELAEKVALMKGNPND
jgi:hypothetical protein